MLATGLPRRIAALHLGLLTLIGPSSAAIPKRDVSVPSDLPTGWISQGCYTDVGRTIGDASYTDQISMTDESCIAFCASKGYRYAGTEYYHECYCGSELASGAAQVADSDCSYPCAGNASEACGGSSLLNLFFSTVPLGPEPNPGVDGWDYVGCYTEGDGGRALTVGIGSVPNAQMTVALCTAACKAAGYILAGVEYAGECYCDNSIQNGAVPASSGCTMACNGNSSEICGGPSRLSLYDYLDEFPISSLPPQSTTTAPPASSSTAPPLPTGMPDGWTYKGCFIDGATGRILKLQLPDSKTNNQESCAQRCLAMNYQVSGTEFGTQCFCSNYTENSAALAPESDCSISCPGNAAEKCGAGNRVNIWSFGNLTQYATPSVQTTGLDGSWTYQGCLQNGPYDAAGHKTFNWQIVMYAGIMTPNMCLNRCAEFGYAAAGLEYGEQCYCGDPANIATAGAAFVAESNCQVICAGLPSAYCGGGDLMTTYFWTGTPLYSWDFAQGAAAGQYDLLTTGPTVPLMTMQSITGKVSFLSKGPGNEYETETGAYELDLTSVGTDLEWRTLHVLTDIFCSAGLVLPDKVGRQLTIGGWAGSSTHGTRLYWPDGSAGVAGTHDWQENVDELSLQGQRWYPSAMQLVNGSILVMGGEQCSNCAPTPTLEILPYTGTEPVFMEWLNRTDPNNLYPFLFVLPSGGIFAGYWNEARILDATTFETIRTLPNMPGAVRDDDTGGRTYPNQGSAILLPQKAPYTDPINVLVCGGATVNDGLALDTCVSIFPDDPTAEWVIERMPSVRVMPAIAPLPDGTYFVANGAVAGWAGFGKAWLGNYNALIYDPAKPVHSRFTVMANTTIKRLYHNEAITLLDGRILVSGSDPTGSPLTQTPDEPEEYRIETFSPPYLLTGKPRPSFTITNKDWTYGQTGITFTLGQAAQNGAITASLLGAVSSTHGNSMGARTLLPAISCTGTSCTVEAPPNANIAPPGWYQFFVLDGGIPAIGTYVRIGGDPAALGNWPPFPDFSKPGV
ncbi:glyoxal oxidase like protein [Thozetella sp. PMI_491]|nr:glyoxal oxidase like protein [Thozetella sp. PMI_491]